MQVGGVVLSPANCHQNRNQNCNPFYWPKSVACCQRIYWARGAGWTSNQEPPC
jgi:hypothetical protein